MPSVKRKSEDNKKSFKKARKDPKEPKEVQEEAEPAESTGKENREEQKKLLKERRLKRKSGIEVERIKKLWEKLRVRNPPVPKDVRKKICDETWELCQGVIGDLVLKHDASRVVQTLVKFSDKERRDQICKELQPYYYGLATSPYGKYLLVKLLHYGSKESRALIIKSLQGKFKKLMRHREGAYVLEDLYVLYATPAQQRLILREFWGSQYSLFSDTEQDLTIQEAAAKSPEAKKIICDNLYTSIKASVEKGSTGFQVLHAVMREYIHVFEGEQVSEFIDLVVEQLAEMVHTPEGSEVASTIVALATPKQRKFLLRGLKDHATLLVENEYGNTVLQTIFMVVDDTKMVAKNLVSAYTDNMIELLCHKYARRPFLYLVGGLDTAFFPPRTVEMFNKYVELAKNTTKKSSEKKRVELLGFFAPVFYKSLQSKPYQLLGENMGAQFVQELLMCKDYGEGRAAALDLLIDCVKGDLSKDDHLIHSRYTERLLKSLLQGGRWNREEKRVVKIDGIGIGADFAHKFASELFDNGENEDALKMWIGESASAFVLVGLVDCLKEEEGSELLESLRGMSKYIGKQDNKGAKLLGEVLSK